MATLNSTQESDRLIRELMVKNKNLQSKLDLIASSDEARSAAASKVQAQLAAAHQENRKLASNVASLTQERDQLSAERDNLRAERNELVCSWLPAGCYHAIRGAAADTTCVYLHALRGPQTWMVSCQVLHEQTVRMCAHMALPQCTFLTIKSAAGGGIKRSAR
jgi:hypothetical protein